jgi:hypothetical protein
MTAIMSTDNASFHAADYHAEVTAEKIVVVGEGAPENITSAARTFRKKVEAILTRHHTAVEVSEQAALAANAAAHYDTPLTAVVDPTILPEIVAAAKGTVLEAHFSRSDVQAAVMQELEHETRSQMHIHRAGHKASAA